MKIPHTMIDGRCIKCGMIEGLAASTISCGSKKPPPMVKIEKHDK